MNLSLRLGFAHEIGLAIATTMSILIVLLGGELPPWAWLGVAVPWISCALAQQGRTAPALAATIVGLAGVAFGIVSVVRGGLESSVVAGAEVLLALLAARLLVRASPAHDLQAIVLSLFLVLTGSALNVTVSYILVFVPYAVAAVWALSTRQLLAVAAQGDGARTAFARGRRDIVTPAFFLGTAAISVAVLASAVLVFAAFPRVGFGDIGAFLMKESKLPRAVGLHGDPRGAGSTAPVARLRGVPRDAFDDGLYLRGVVYDVVTLEGFSQSPRPEGRGWPTLQLGAAPIDARYEVTVTPGVGDTLLTLGGVVAMRALGGGNANPNLSLGISGRTDFDELKAYAPLTSPMRYEVAGGIARPGFVSEGGQRTPRPLSEPERRRWLALPAASDGVVAAEDFDKAIAGLAAETSMGAGTARETAAALRLFFLGNFIYSQTPPRFTTSPLRTFLLEDRQGHCEYFASAFVLLLRSRGVPARVVGGFQGGAWNGDVVVFQERHAHAWVEWWDDAAGWIVDDATPLAAAAREDLAGIDSFIERFRHFWDDRVLDYSLQDQSDALSQARRSLRRMELPSGTTLLGLAIPVVLASALLAVSRMRRRRRAHAHPLAEAIVEAVARATRAPVEPSSTLREAVARVDHEGPLRDALVVALGVYERERFGGTRASAMDRQDAMLALRRAARAPARDAGA
jgi:hypothetical protein